MALEVGTKVRIMAVGSDADAKHIGKVGEVRQDNGTFAVVKVKGTRGAQLLMLTHQQFIVKE